MIRFILILTSLAALNNVFGQDKMVVDQPIRESEEAKCNSVQCDDKTDDKLNKLILEVAASCNCCYGCKSKVYYDLCKLCEDYRNYDPKTSGLNQCIINKLSNPCYKYYKSFQQILNSGCGNLCHKSNFNIYTFLYDVCYGCNGCLWRCYIQNGDTIHFDQPYAAKAGPTMTSTLA
ncbi:uncharacterized protein LOC116337828 [Contarinia nasturtii]|uniref:uncharacterized protein LOC116337828 n=1 Tax=Contarinia nasturtii TaxID=265458 RepID=UPI0012D3ED6C|nr:uncharacterized protein LOC116337828 [Contarinia nasturtii]